MRPDFILLDNVLIIQGLSVRKKIFYVLRILFPFLLTAVIIWFTGIQMAWLLIFNVFLYISFSHILFAPSVFFNIRITKVDDGILINRKKMLTEEMLFLSIREKDAYKVIRLEAQRRNIIKANEKVLKTDCVDFEDAYRVCCSLRDFMNPALKINHIRVGYNVAGKPDESIEVWEYIA